MHLLNDHNSMTVDYTGYCILLGWIKGFSCSITTILFEVGSYRTVVG